jgi:hypothetical protein
MNTNPLRPQGWSKHRLVRALWVSLGLAVLALVGAWAAVMISDLMQSGHPLRGALLGGFTLLLLILGLLVASAQWRTKPPPRRRHHTSSSESADQTGIWGVGGPSMREPGNTGNWSTRKVDRRYENSRD